MAEPGEESKTPSPPASGEILPAPEAAGRVRILLSSLRSLLTLTWVSRACLLALLTLYLVSFGRENSGMLTDPALQNDDARTILFPFHTVGSQGTLGDDPISDEMLSAVPWGVRLLYLAFVPLVDLYVASKIVQAVAFGILGWAFAVLVRSRRTGLAAAVFLTFLTLHTVFAVDRIAGGLPRAFGFPCFSLWLAGVLANNRAARFSAPVLLALSYPSVMNMILAAEGLLAIRGMFRTCRTVVLRRLKRYAILVGVCIVCVLPATVGSSERGPIHTLEQAEQEPAFGRRGRLWLLPFSEPVGAVSEAFFDPVTPRGARPGGFFGRVENEKGLTALLVLGFFLLIPALRLTALPGVPATFFVGTLVIYALSRVFAFRLYSPERYYSFGMRMACIALLVSCVAYLFYWHKRREVARNFVTTALIGGMWLILGDGLSRNTGMTINAGTDRNLYEFIRTLPKDAKFAAHIMDGDGIPFWGARAHTGSFETLQPWFTQSWARQKERTLATLEALYATEEDVVLRFAEKYKVTHFLVNRSRYGRALHSKAGSFEPFSTEVRRILADKDEQDMVLAHAPPSTEVFRDGRFRVVSVEEFRRSMRREAK
jgi:hypothetical protein